MSQDGLTDFWQFGLFLVLFFAVRKSLTPENGLRRGMWSNEECEFRHNWDESSLPLITSLVFSPSLGAVWFSYLV